MSSEITMLLLRVVIIVLPASFACFILGYIWGRNVTWRQEIAERKAMTVDEPDFIEEAQTIVTKRNRKVML